jgi:hypothetical protein
MKTRTLLLLSVGCGLLILLAGGAKLLQVATDRTEVPVLKFGELAQIGDMAVRVIDITGNSLDDPPSNSTGNGTLVEITMSGVPGAPVIDDWRLLADGKVFPASGANGDDEFCAASTRVPDGGTEVRCVLRFPAAETVQAVAYTRAGEQRQWAP